MKFILNNDKLTIQEPECNNSGSINYYLVDVEANEQWEGLNIVAVLTPKEGSCCDNQGRAIAVINNQLYIDNSINGYYAIGFMGFNLQYQLTQDITIDSNKTYYTRSGQEGSYIYTKVENPVVADIGTYYEAIKSYQISTDLQGIWFNQGAGEIEITNEDIPTPSEWQVYVAQIQAMINSIGTETNYNDLQNKPQINSVELTGNKSLHDLGIQPEGNYYTKPNAGIPSTDMTSEVQALLGKANTALQENDNISKLNNNAGFITNAVNDLVNYYTKSETFTKQEVNDLISAITTLDLQVVQTLPTQDISTTTIYLVPKTTAQTNNAYDEYIYISNNWEFIGSTEVDLTHYVQDTDYASLNNAGIIKIGVYGTVLDENKRLCPVYLDYNTYSSQSGLYFISKGTLENVITGKELVNKTYVDNIVGNIETILTTLDVGGGVE